jgi:hypothetical protein
MSVALSINMQGTAQVMQRIAELKRRAPDSFAAGVYLAASNVITTAMRLTPVDTGWLRSSRYVRKPRVSGDTFKVEAGFGASYAIFVHEINRDYVVGEWKFLTTAANYHAPTFATEVAGNVARMMAAGVGIDSVTTVHPTEPMDETNRAGLEGLASRYRRRKSAATKRKRAAAKVRNRERRARESLDALEAQRAGRRANRPGRG